MQVNIISLLDLILNHCNFQGIKNDNNTKNEDERVQKCISILGDDLLIGTIILGLKQDISFVR